jgi:adenosine deaminase
MPLSKENMMASLLSLPKADLHIHQEVAPRLDRVLARSEERRSYDWERWVQQLQHDIPPGIQRLRQLAQTFPVDVAVDAIPENFIARVEDLLEESARDGAILVEIRFGGETMLRADYLDLFREAERRVQSRYPNFHAEAIATLLLWYEPERLERVIHACLQQASQGLRGLDLLYEPYAEEADWSIAHQIAERAREAGLGITIHAGEFSPANLLAVARLPGVSRIGHGVFIASNPRIQDTIGERGLTVECCLTSNVVLGACPSLESHPIRLLLAAGIPVVLGTDDPVQLGTTIGQEYAKAATLGFSYSDLLGLTRQAIQVAFTTTKRRERMLSLLDQDCTNRNKNDQPNHANHQSDP